jgi:hypothetical protein
VPPINVSAPKQHVGNKYVYLLVHFAAMVSNPQTLTTLELHSPQFSFPPSRKGRFSMKRVFPYAILIFLFSSIVPAFGQTNCPVYTFVKIADTTTPVPGGNGGSFEGLKLSMPAADSLRVAFRGEGGGVEGVFVGDGQTLSPVALVGNPLPGGGTITDISQDFAFSGGVFNLILNTPSSGNHGIYATDGGGLSKTVGFGQAAPGGGVFSTIAHVSRQGDNMAYDANISFGPGVNGIFTTIGGVNELVADTTTEIPGSEPTVFAGGSFSDPDISGQNVAFRAGASALIGVHARIDGTLVKVADRNDTQPGSVKPFSTFSVPVISGDQVAFRGVGDFAGIYVGDGGPLTVIARSGDPAPGGSTFNGFAQNVAIDGEAVAFSGAGSGFIGLFVSDQYGLCRVIDTNDTLEGEDVTQLFMGRDSYSEGMLSFQAVFFDGRRGIYLAIAPPRAEIIGTWNSGIWYWDVAAAAWTQMTTETGAEDAAAGDFNGDGKADVASSWVNGLWYQDGATSAWTQIDSLPPDNLTAGDVTGDGRPEIIGSWSSGIWYWDVVASTWTEMTPFSTTGDIAAGDFTADGKADVASIWPDGLWYQDGATLAWTKIDDTPPFRVTAGDVTGDGRPEIIGTWSSGIWYWDVVASTWTEMTPFSTTGDIAAGDFTADGKADVASIWPDGLWYQDGDTLDWIKIDNSPPFRVTAGDVTGQ